MMDLMPRLGAGDLGSLAMTVSNPKHLKDGGLTGFSGSFDHGGIVKDWRGTGQGTAMADLGVKIGTEAVMRNGSLGAAGLNRPDNASFSDVMLKAIDRVSGDQGRVSALEEAAMTNPGSVDIHDITIAQAEAGISLNIARTVLSRLTQAWRDIINVR
jgi:flagellar hook-basal body complex protein FliE